MHQVRVKASYEADRKRITEHIQDVLTTVDFPGKFLVVFDRPTRKLQETRM